MTDLILVSDNAGVRLVTLNRPEKKNALTQAMYAAMIDAIDSADTDPSVRVVVIAANGPIFTSGNDLADFATGTSGSDSPAARFPFVLAHAQKPLIACVNGLAVGVGVTMLAQCDLVYASQSARFRTPFVDLALVPEGASSLLLPAIVGRTRANELLLMGETWDANEALSAGLINKIFSDETLLASVLEKANLLASKAPGAIRTSKTMLAISKDKVFERITTAGDLFANQLTTPEFGEAITAFMSRRPADFSRFS
jgi:enoyl-CoA hydratase/carnithine racemase